MVQDGSSYQNNTLLTLVLYSSILSLYFLVLPFYSHHTPTYSHPTPIVLQRTPTVLSCTPLILSCTPIVLPFTPIVLRKNAEVNEASLFHPWYNRSLWIAYDAFKAASYSIDRSAVWLRLENLGVPKKIVSLIRELYSNTFGCVRVDGQLSDWFEVKSGVRQGCTIALDLFLAPMDWLLQGTVHRGLLGATMGNEVFTDLDELCE